MIDHVGESGSVRNFEWTHQFSKVNWTLLTERKINNFHHSNLFSIDSTPKAHLN